MQFYFTVSVHNVIFIVKAFLYVSLWLTLCDSGCVIPLS
ncbi:hypothetical protein T03_15575 [Trichinella britovi]|uniref:Uncharacterized protein n=1 Tax=Trichinella britovi TaxID=45882 RepID=A0A0V0YZT1_TRIBR|nr:hypothetical protein T03_15575 [Trichinella britovi]